MKLVSIAVCLQQSRWSASRGYEVDTCLQMPCSRLLLLLSSHVHKKRGMALFFLDLDVLFMLRSYRASSRRYGRSGCLGAGVEAYEKFCCELSFIL